MNPYAAWIDHHQDNHNWLCWRCLKGHGIQLAHIFGGAGRRVDDPRAVVLLCEECHMHDQHMKGWIKPGHLLWLKRKYDPDHYDREFLQSIYNRGFRLDRPLPEEIEVCQS